MIALFLLTAPCPIGHGWLMLHRMKFDARSEWI